jgi:hypothetical protein
MSSAPGRNDPCPCGSGRKFKQCCLGARAVEDTARQRLRDAEGRVVDESLRLIARTWGEPLMLHAWDDFLNYDDVPEHLGDAPEFESMFIPWLRVPASPTRSGTSCLPAARSTPARR